MENFLRLENVGVEQCRDTAPPAVTRGMTCALKRRGCGDKPKDIHSLENIVFDILQSVWSGNDEKFLFNTVKIHHLTHY